MTRQRFNKIKLASFLLILSLLSGLIFYMRKIQPENHPLEKISTTLESREDVFFYDRIGEGLDTKTPKPTSKQQFSVRIAENIGRSEAEVLVNQLSDLGFQAYMNPIQSQGKVQYHVDIGVFPEKILAEEIAQKLRSQKFPNSRVRTLF